MKQIRKRLTYANVMSTIAVFLVLGGASALAASQLGKNSVGSKQLKNNAVTSAKIKNNAVTSAKIKNGAITGAKVNLGSLGTVPSATNATNATNAGNANTVGGRTVTKIFAKIAKNTSQTIGTFGVYQIDVTCSAAGDPSITLSTVATDTDFAGMGNGTDNAATEHSFFDREQDGGSISLSGPNVRGTTTFSAAQSGGAVTAGTISYDDTDSFNNELVCAVYGQAIS